MAGRDPTCESARVFSSLLLAADEVSWYDVPAVRIIGLVVGAVFLIAAIRAMFR